MALYFAYGSNMGTIQMAQRCPGSRRIGPAFLDGYRWFIAEQGFASVRPDLNGTVEGILWALTPADEQALDRFEDVHLDLYRRHHLPVRHNGSTQLALVYIDPIDLPGTAAPEYILRLNQALRDAELSPAYIANQIRPLIP
jgi:hypothetical protein